MLPLLLAATAMAVPNQVELVPKYRLDTSYVAQAPVSYTHLTLPTTPYV